MNIFKYLALGTGLTLTFTAPALASFGDTYISDIAGPSKIEIRGCARFAGAICSLRWNGREFVDNWDHGRQIQSAAQFYFAPDDGIDHPETYNPTEAGTHADGQGNTSSSKLLAINISSSNVLETKTQMAFYLAPGDQNQHGEPVLNTTILSNYQLLKKVTIGEPGIAHAIPYRSMFKIPTNESPVRGTFENVTTYLPGEFSSFYFYSPKKCVENTNNCQPTPFVNNTISKLENHIIASTSDKKYALGIYTPIQEFKKYNNNTQHGKETFQLHNASSHKNRAGVITVNKLNSVFRIKNLSTISNKGKEFHFISYLVVGSLDNVKVTMDQLYTRHP